MQLKTYYFPKCSPFKCIEIVVNLQKYFQRYDVEMACYGNSPPSGQILKGAKRAKKKKDPNAPKRSM